MKCPMKVMRPGVVTARIAAALNDGSKPGDPCQVSGDCGGELVLLEHGQTYLGNVVGCDPNEHREVYRCTSCGSVVERAFKWRLVKEGGS